MRIFILSLLCFLVAISANAFVLNSNDFANENLIPVKNTCDGKNISPELNWKGLPPNTQSFVLLFEEQETSDQPIYHWGLYNIPAHMNELLPNVEPTELGMSTLKNSFQKISYQGPCPAQGSVQKYTFTLYALDIKLALPADSAISDVVKAMEGHIVEKTSLTAVYARWPTQSL